MAKKDLQTLLVDVDYDLQLFADDGAGAGGSDDDPTGDDPKPSAEERIAELEKQLSERENALAEAEKKNAKLKGTMDVKLKELGEMTKRERERMTAEERERKEIEEIKAQNELLLKEREVVSAERRFIQSGCDAELASEGARALIEKDHDALFKVIEKMISDKVANEKAELLKTIPKPQGGSSSQTMTKEQFNKLGYKARVELAAKDPDLYNKFTQ